MFENAQVISFRFQVECDPKSQKTQIFHIQIDSFLKLCVAYQEIID